MSIDTKKNEVDERRAAMLLGVTPAELRRLSRLSGIGHMEVRDQHEIMIYTYEELRQLCLLSSPSVD